MERAVVRLALDGCDRARVLEIGSGYGRMTPELLGHDGEVVVSDYDVGALESMELPPIHPPPALRIALNLYHLPFPGRDIHGGNVDSSTTISTAASGPF